MRVAIVGAGAIGGWIGVTLAKASADVSVLAHGETLRCIAANGLRLTIGGETQNARVRASDRAEDLGLHDLVVITVKSQSLAAVAPAAAQLLGRDGLLLPAMNGVPWWFTHGLGGPLADAALASVDPTGTTARTLPLARVIGCVVHASCFRRAPGWTEHKMGRRLIIGEPLGGTSEPLPSASAVSPANSHGPASRSPRAGAFSKTSGTSCGQHDHEPQSRRSRARPATSFWPTNSPAPSSCA